MIPRRLAWMAVGGALALTARGRAERAVAAEAERLSRRLPAPAGTLLERVAPDVARAAGVAVVAGRSAVLGGRVGYRAAVVGGRTARSAGSAAGAAARVAARGGAAAQVAVRRARDEADRAQRTWQGWVDEEERLLRADLARLAGDGTAAVDALVDRRAGPAPVALVEVPPPVPAGRPRPAPAPAPGPGRVQRSYQRPPRPW